MLGYGRFYSLPRVVCLDTIIGTFVDSKLGKKVSGY
jgi:hypothetical protein